MINPDIVRLLHRHGDSWTRLNPVEHHSPADHDPERDWSRRGRLFRCDSCDEEVLIVPEGAERPIEPR
ncbi:MAG TPA: hypothetical protein VIV06_07815 [Candidatus Limnocylindrales bacterium]